MSILASRALDLTDLLGGKGLRAELRLLSYGLLLQEEVFEGVDLTVHSGWMPEQRSIQVNGQ